MNKKLVFYTQTHGHGHMCVFVYIGNGLIRGPQRWFHKGLFSSSTQLVGVCLIPTSPDLVNEKVTGGLTHKK